MDNYTAMEQAYKNGYEVGEKEAAKEVFQKLFDEFSKCAIKIEEEYNLKESIGMDMAIGIIEWYAAKYGIELKENK